MCIYIQHILEYIANIYLTVMEEHDKGKLRYDNNQENLENYRYRKRQEEEYTKNTYNEPLNSSTKRSRTQQYPYNSKETNSARNDEHRHYDSTKRRDEYRYRDNNESNYDRIRNEQRYDTQTPQEYGTSHHNDNKEYWEPLPSSHSREQKHNNNSILLNRYDDGERQKRVGFGERAEFLARQKEERKREMIRNMKLEDIRAMDENEAMNLLGLPNSFNSTCGKQVPKNSKGYASIKKNRVYRQYMNRLGGFNRPLDKV